MNVCASAEAIMTAEHATDASFKAAHLESPHVLKIAVGIATRGRAQVLRETLRILQQQQRLPDALFVAYTDPKDIGDLQSTFQDVTFIMSTPGLTHQRNNILQLLPAFDVVAFIDDDFFPGSTYLYEVEQTFVNRIEIVAVTGLVLADGINSSGITIDQAENTLAAYAHISVQRNLREVFNAYGCNMSLRLETIRQNKLQFDEALPLYGWYEDVDFSRQLASFGKIVQQQSAYGVHLGAKSGRQSGLRLGYSQIANPWYLHRKHRVSIFYSSASMLSRSMKNLVRCLHPEPFVDRKGRLRGNLLAWRDLILGAIHPTRILQL